MNTKTRVLACALVALFVARAAGAAAMTFRDPIGDDKGPGTYTYPTDGVYTPGSFDLVECAVSVGDNAEFKVTMNDRLADPWGMGVGFATQMIFIFIDTTAGKSHTKSLPGLNVDFAEDSAWDKVVILSTQQASRLSAEVRAEAADLAADIVIPRRTTGNAKTISAKVNLGELGGGNDGECDPRVMDILAPGGNGAPDEAQAQYDMLRHECAADGSSVKRARLIMVRK